MGSASDNPATRIEWVGRRSGTLSDVLGVAGRILVDQLALVVWQSLLTGALGDGQGRTAGCSRS